MREIFALGIKDIRLLLRDKGGFFFTFFFPLIMAVFFGIIFAGNDGTFKPMSLLVVDKDKSIQSSEFVTLLNNSEELNIQEMNYKNALAKVRSGKNPAFIVLPKGFGKARDELFWGKTPEIEIGVDPARKAEAGMIEGLITKYAMENMFKLFSNMDYAQNIAESGLKSVKNSSMETAQKENYERFLGELNLFLEKKSTNVKNSDNKKTDNTVFRPFTINKIEILKSDLPGSYDITFPQGMIWGIIGCVASFAISFVIERTHGTLVRLRIAPIRYSQILAGKAMACFFTSITLMIGLFALGIIAFGIRPNSYLFMFITIIINSFSFVGIMMLFSVIGKTEQAVGGMIWAVMLVMALLGGGMVPLFFMPSWLSVLSNFSPVKWAILGMEGAIWRGFTFSEMLLPWGILIGIGIISFIIGIRVFKLTSNIR